MSQTDLFKKSGAALSDCGTYRYRLWRIWDETLQNVMFMLHNPSTADASVDDPTVRRCIRFARDWGYGGIFIGNISPYRATNPDELKGKDLKVLIPDENLGHTIEMAQYCHLHVLAHGVLATKELNLFLLPLVRWHCLGKTQDGYPKHPLYLKSDLKPIPFIFSEYHQSYFNQKK